MMVKDLDHVSPEAYILYLDGLECMREEDYGRARSLFTDALIIERNCSKFLIALGTSFYESEPEAGRDPLEFAHKTFSRVPIAHFELSERYLPGHTLELLRCWDKARDAYFSALSSCDEPYDVNELSMIHSGLTLLSEQPNLKISRPRGFNIPKLNILLSTSFNRKEFNFQLRTFERGGNSIRLITVEIDDLIEEHCSIRRRMIRSVKQYLGEPKQPLLPDNTIWIFHYKYSDYSAHYLEKVEIVPDTEAEEIVPDTESEDKIKLIHSELLHDEFEALCGYRLFWKPEYEM